jgi:hypothetical protein
MSSGDEFRRKHQRVQLSVEAAETAAKGAWSLSNQLITDLVSEIGHAHPGVLRWIRVNEKLREVMVELGDISMIIPNDEEMGF